MMALTFALSAVAVLAASSAAFPVSIFPDGMNFHQIPAVPTTRSGIPFSMLPEPKYMVQYAQSTIHYPLSVYNKGGVTPLHTFYMPTHKCVGIRHYCRAQIVAYEEFEGRIVLQVGYSVWFFDAPSEPLHPKELYKIAHTTMNEIVSYIDTLKPLMEQTYGDVCKASLFELDQGMKKAIDEFGQNCVQTTDYKCEHTVTVKTC